MLFLRGLGLQFYHRRASVEHLAPSVEDEVVVRCISEIQSEVHSRALMGIDEKRDRLRQMIDGEIPTKVIRRKDGSEEFVYDMLGALIADAKMAGEFDGSKAAEKDPGLNVTFRVLRRNHPIPPREWLERDVMAAEMIEEGRLIKPSVTL